MTLNLVMIPNDKPEASASYKAGNTWPVWSEIDVTVLRSDVPRAGPQLQMVWVRLQGAS